MPNIVEYTVKIRDLAGGQLDKISAKSKTVSANVNELNLKLKEIEKQRNISVNSKDIKALNAEMDKTQHRINMLQNSGRNIGMSLAQGLMIAGGAYAAYSAAKQVVMTTARYEAVRNSIKFAAGNQGAGLGGIAFIEDIAKKQGLDLAASLEGYKTILGGAQGKLNTTQVQKIFTGIALASNKMGLSADNQKGALLALGQMLSKGTVQAEELRGQLGERLPGAFQIFARSLGVTTQQLGKMLEKGEVLAYDALPKFAEEMIKTFGGPATENIYGKLNELNNSWDKLLFTIGNSSKGPIYGTIELLQDLADAATRVAKAIGYTSQQYAEDYAGEQVALAQKNQSYKDGIEEQFRLLKSAKSKQLELRQFMKKSDYSAYEGSLMMDELKGYNQEIENYQAAINALKQAMNGEKANGNGAQALASHAASLHGASQPKNIYINPGKFIDQVTINVGPEDGGFGRETAGKFEDMFVTTLGRAVNSANTLSDQ